MKAILVALCLLTTLAAKAADTTPPVVSLQSLLEEMTDRAAVARWPVPAYTCRLASSYDRASKTPADPTGWFANNDWSQFIRMEQRQGRREWVMLDAAGPGAIVRFWTGGKPAIGTIRFYLDGAPQPVLAGQMQDLLTGKGDVPAPLASANPKQAGNLYLPIPYAKQCTITYEESDPQHPASPPPKRWYNIEYRTYAPGTPVQTLTKTELNRLQPGLKDPGTGASGQPIAFDATIEPGKEALIALPAGPSAIRLLEIRIGNADAQALRSLVLRAEFDGEETIWCPISDFFGSGVGVNVLESWYRTVGKEGTMCCRWVMPYRQTARFTLVNLGKQPVPVAIRAAVGAWQWDDRSLHFHANWRQQSPVATQPRSDWNYLTATGQGIYVGDTLCVLNPVTRWWGEGDEKVWVDGESFPSLFGTGTEDYYGYAWGDPRLFQGPFCNQIRCDGSPRTQGGSKNNQGQTVITRTRSLDAIPFTKSLQFDMEVWHWEDCRVGYAATTYWYAKPGATSNRGPLPEEAARPIPALQKNETSK